MKEAITSHIRTHLNFADLLTKVLYGETRRRLVRGLMYDVYDEINDND